jgi:predicted phage gp36 major capsid-like protein
VTYMHSKNALPPPQFSADAQRCANLAVLNMLRQMETSAGALKFPAMQDNPPEG